MRQAMDHANGINGRHNGDSHNGPPARERPGVPTLERAIQCSPFLSIMPLSQETIAFPDARPPTLPPTPFVSSDLEHVDHLLHSLNTDTKQNTQLPIRCQTVVNDIQALLSCTNDKDYIFKTAGLATHSARGGASSQARTNAGQASTQRESSKLGAFADMLLKRTDTRYEYPKPMPQDVNTLLRSLEAATSPNKATTAGQSDSSVHSPFRPSPYASTTTMIPTVVVPASAPGPYNGEHLDATSTNGGSRIAASAQKTPSPNKQRKREQVTDTASKKIDVNLDDRERVETAVRQLQELIFNVLEAEDQLEPDTSGVVSKHAEEYFVSASDGSNYVLRPESHNNLEDSIIKVLKARRFADISIDHLLRIQKLCAASFVATHELDLSIPISGDNDVVGAWSTRIRAAENSLRATKILLRMMGSGREEKRLQSDEILQDLLANVRYVLDKAIVPVIEVRASSNDNEFWSHRKEHVALLSTVLARLGRVIRLLGDLVLKLELSETAINAIDFLSTNVVFLENVPSEKDSILGVQKVENLRRHAMDLLAKVFLRHPDQRAFIFDEILSSLEKLPVTRQSARQYRVMDGKPIQLVSALILQLIQTSAMRVTANKKQGMASEKNKTSEDAENEKDSDVESDQSALAKFKATNADTKKDRERDIQDSLSDIADPLYNSAWENARYVAKYLVQRALTSTKSGDQPYRNLLDIFTEDFLNVLGSPDWPASEMMLRALLGSLVNITDSEKSAAPAKNMALDLMALMGTSIADLQAHLQRSVPNLENGASPSQKLLLGFVEDTLGGSTTIEEQLFQAIGPYGAVLAHFEDGESENLQTQSACSYFLAQWATKVNSLRDHDEESTGDKDLDELYDNLRMWILHMNDINLPNEFSDISFSETRLAYAVVMLNLPFCRGLPRIFNILLRSLSSSQATVRSKAIKSVVQLLEKDPAILERSGNVLSYIVNSTSDSSPMVRDSALGLIGKCMSLKPALEAEGCKTLIARSLDTATTVRKRALRLLREVYPRTKSKDVKAAIADAILRRVADAEESVAELARQMMEEMWLYPDLLLVKPDEAGPAKLELQLHAYHIVFTVVRSLETLTVFGLLLKAALHSENKNASTNRALCKTLLSTIFEGIIDNDVDRGVPAQSNLLETLTVFAKSDARLFNAAQMTTLKPYIENLASEEDLIVYRAVVVIYRCVLPVLPPLQHTFLQDVQNILFSSISKLGKAELSEIAACLSIIDGVLQNTERLVKLMLSVLTGISNIKRTDIPSDTNKMRQVKRYIMIAGHFGKACNLETYKNTYKEKFPKIKSDTVSGLMVDIIAPFASPDLDLSVREVALEAICLICQASPKNFLKASVTTTFSATFQDNEPQLALAIVNGVKEFYLNAEERSKARAEGQAANSATDGTNRLVDSMVLSDLDSAATSMAQHFLPHIIRLSLASTDELALVATEVMASTNRQGLVHPKETGPALVALETSPNIQIAQLARVEHQALHDKHESVLEPEYIKAVERAFTYQRDTVKEMSGIDSNQQPKLRLFFEVLKSGSIGLRKKLLGKLCTRSLIDVNKIESMEHILEHLLSVRFMLENLSTLDYSRIDEIMSILAAIEKAFSTTGQTVSQRIEAVLGSPSALSATDSDNAPTESNKAVDPNVLRQLSACSMVLTLLWETRTHLRKAWSLQSLKVGAKVKQQAKDTSKAPNKATTYPGLVKEHLAQIGAIMTSLNTPEAMVARCRGFQGMLAVDNELKVGSDEDENGQSRLKTPEEDEEPGGDPGTPASRMAPESVPGSSTRGRKRKASSIGGTPRKPRLSKKPSMSRKVSRARSRSKGPSDDEGEWE